MTFLQITLDDSGPLEMAITILPPVVEDLGPSHAESDVSMSVDSDSESDIEMSGVPRPHKRARLENQRIGAGIVTPGEVVTDDPQWMRWVSSCQGPFLSARGMYML